MFRGLHTRTNFHLSLTSRWLLFGQEMDYGAEDALLKFLLFVLL